MWPPGSAAPFPFCRYGGTYWKIWLSEHNNTKPPERRSECDPSDWNSLVNCTLLQSCPACRTLQVPLPALLHLPQQSWWSCLATTNEPRASPLTERGRKKKNTPSATGSTFDDEVCAVISPSACNWRFRINGGGLWSVFSQLERGFAL